MLHLLALNSSRLGKLPSPLNSLRFSMSILALACCCTLSASTQAGLVPGGGDLDNDLNNALRFDPSTPTPVKVAYKDASLPVDRFIQVGFRTTTSNPINISSIAWSRDNITYTSFNPNDFVNNVNSASVYRYSSVIDLGSTIGGTSSTPFFVRYTLPTGIDIGSVVQSVFLANSNGAVTNGVISAEIGNGFVSLTRLHTAVPEPTSLLLLSSVGAWGIWRRVKRSK
jgi:hypothetical protein